MNRVSSLSVVLVVLFLLFGQSGIRGQSRPARDPRKLFETGEAALHAGKLDEAERAFRQVLAINPSVAGAYANLGGIHMRRKQWPQALEMLHKAEKRPAGSAW